MAAVREDFTALPGLGLRAMATRDVPVVIAIERSSYTFPWSEGIFRDCLRVGYICRVAELEREVVAYGVMSAAANEAHVLNLCVLEQHRSRGIGARMLVHLIELARAAGAAEVFLEVRPSNTAAIRLYQAQGFAQIGTRRAYYQALNGREDAVVLRRALRQG